MKTTHPALESLISLKGRTALVTGAVGGIGKATALRLGEAGASLVLVDRDTAGLQKLKEELSGKGIEAVCYTVDLEKKEEIDRLWENPECKKVNILVNNAGIYPFKNFTDLDEGYLNKVMTVNLYSTIWMCQNFIKVNKRRKGSIVNIGSIEAIMPFKKDLAHYSMSKVGVIALTRDLARDFGRKGIRANALIPGGIITAGTKSAAKKALIGMDFSLMADGYNFMQRLPSGRLGNPDEVARMILVLVSDLASYVTGALLPVDGGFLSA
ncbi:MAG: SDR family oxidoreductase [Chitinophagaceae bacterium]|nr:SDR family oxidoreductase [Chitinophagaceae bacterium]